MHRIDGPDVAVSLPTPSAVGTPGYFRKATASVRGTVARTDWLNAVQEELANAIIDAGLALDKTAQDQLSTALTTIAQRGIVGADTGTVSGTTSWDRGLVLCWDGGGGGPSVSEEGAVALGAGGGVISAGAQGSALIATTTGTIGGDRCVVMAASGSAGVINAAASDSGIIGSNAGSSLGANAARAWIIGSDRVDIGAVSNAFNAVAVASLDAVIDANRAFLAAVDGDTSDGDDVAVKGAQSAIIAATGGASSKCAIEGTATTSFMAAVGGALINGGDFNAILASGTNTSGSDPDITSTGDNNFIAAAIGALISGTANASAILAAGYNGTARPTITTGGGLAFLAAASGLAEISGARGFELGVAGGSSGDKAQVTGDNSGIAALVGSATVSGSQSMLVCSDCVSGTPTLSADNRLAGASDSTITWYLDSANGDLFLNGDVGFYGTAPAAKPTVTGSRGGNAALASLLTALAGLGLITDSSTA